MHDPVAGICHILFLLYLGEVVVVDELVEEVFKGAIGIFDVCWHFLPFDGGTVLDVVFEAGRRRGEAAYFCGADFSWFVTLAGGSVEGELEGGGAGVDGKDEEGIGVRHGGRWYVERVEVIQRLKLPWLSI